MSRPTIICVDDERVVLISLRDQLKQLLCRDYEIELAESGEEALEIIEELLEDGIEIPLIISDQIMPGMKGDELLIRIHSQYPETLKIMLTGQADTHAVGNAVNLANLYRYMAKPWQDQDLLLTVKEALNSFAKDKKLAEKNAKLKKANKELAKLNCAQAELINQLHENENRLKKFLEAMPVGVFVADANGHPYYINSRAEHLLSKGKIADVNAEKLMEAYQVYYESSNQIYSNEESILHKALQGESATADDIEIHTDDKIIPLEAWGTPIYDEHGNLTYAIAAFQDISDRKKAEAERQRFTQELLQLNEAFSRFVPRQFLHFLNKESIVDVQPGEAVQQEMSVLFSDIRDFTSLSENMTPNENFQFINSYLSRLGPAIVENQGFIDKYIGDAIMALFSGGADNALKAAIAMLQRLAEYNQHRVSSGYIPIKIGIGINTGDLMLGTVGEQNRMDSTVISDAVNLASRVEGLTKNYGVSLLISHNTFSRLQNPADYAIRKIDTVQVKGKSERVTVYEVFDADEPGIKQAKLATVDMFIEALTLYNQANYQPAAQLFEKVLRINPDDKVAQIYLSCCSDCSTRQANLQTTQGAYCPS